VPYHYRLPLTYGEASFTYELGWTARELDRSTCDQRVYQQAVHSIFGQFDGRRTTCVTAEMVSYFPSVEAEEARRRGAAFWNVETGPFEKRVLLRLATGTGYAVQTFLGERQARQALPWEAGVHHTGCLKYPWLTLHPSEPKCYLRTLVFFTQPKPTNEEDNRLIGDALVELAEVLQFSLIVKAHPRDLFDYRSRWPSAHVRIADRLTERSEVLTASADCIISRFSTTLSEALYLGTPYMAILLEEQHRGIKMDSVADELGVRRYSVEEMIEDLKEFPAYAENYYRARSAFFKSNIRIPIIPLHAFVSSDAIPAAAVKHAL
jgi:hypothetical protein